MPQGEPLSGALEKAAAEPAAPPERGLANLRAQVQWDSLRLNPLTEEAALHPLDVLHYGHHTVMRTLKAFPEEQVETPGVCGVWSVKDILAHLASYEQILVEITAELQGEGPTPTLDKWRSVDNFNDTEVEARNQQTFEETLQEYLGRYETAAAGVGDLPAEKLRETGAISWYGDGYDLEDFLIYSSYGHKREHSAQIAAFRDRIEG